MGKDTGGCGAGRERAAGGDQVGAEKRALLDELELAYQQLERLLAGAEYERHITYAELHQRHAQLQGRVAELEEEHRRLQEAQRLLLRTERLSAMGQMAAAICHEIGNPLDAVDARVESLLAREQREPTRAGLVAVRAAVGRLRELAQNTLRFSRQRRLQARCLDLDELVRQVHRLFGPLARKVGLEMVLAGGLPPVLADPFHLEQVLINFAMNALDALQGKRGAQILLATEVATLAQLREREEADGWQTYLALGAPSQAQPRPWVCAEVRDNGPGIPAPQFGLIFESFYTTKPEDKGTGLGLAISRSLAAESGGHILVASRAGAGASFRLLLPPAGQAGSVGATGDMPQPGVGDMPQSRGDSGADGCA